MRQHYSTLTGNWEDCSATIRKCQYEHRNGSLSAPAVSSPEREAVEADKASFLDQMVKLWSPKKFDIPESFSLVTSRTKSKEIRVADAGSTAKRCHRCNVYVSEEEVETMYSEDYRCSKCGEKPPTGLGVDTPYVVEIDRGEAVFLVDKKAAKERTWYHATIKKDWEDGVRSNSVYVHAGSREAAEDRIKIDWPNQVFFLYELKLKKNTKFGENAWDDNDFPETTHHPLSETNSPLAADKVTLYVNKYEHPGSVSMVSAPRNFDVVKKSTITPSF
jgi:hypothetical protein